MFPFARPPQTAGRWSGGALRRTNTQVTPFGTKALAIALLVAVAMSSFEGPIRYVLNFAHLDPLIFVRDALLFGALAGFIAARVPGKTVPASIGVFALLAAIHGTVSYANLHTPIAAIYGLKMFVPALCGFLAAQALFDPSPRVVRLVALMWLIALVGATLDKFWLDYPWVGMNVDQGGVSVYLGRDWQSGEIERVGGLTRSSINLAVDMPLLSFMLLTSLRSRIVRAFVCAMTLAVLAWTTQKGAILGYLLAMLALLLSNQNRTSPLKIAVAIAVFAMVFAPTVLVHFDMPHDHGVFSFESIVERIEITWPDAWKWIGRFPPFLGIGLGGIGGGQRFFAPQDFNPADNFFVYLYANFGIASLLYVAAAALVAINMRVQDFRRDGVALASLAFLLTYGLVVSLVEDQIAALWLGAALGWVAQRQPAFMGSFLSARAVSRPISHGAG